MKCLYIDLILRSVCLCPCYVLYQAFAQMSSMSSTNYKEIPIFSWNLGTQVLHGWSSQADLPSPLCPLFPYIFSCLSLLLTVPPSRQHSVI